jgi:thiol:disulfide interchange protein DsbC
MIAALMLAGLWLTAPLFASELDFSKALKIGSGPKVVVEFTDPDCPFCRTASRYLDGRGDVTRYVFFFPLARHPRSKEKVRYILSQRERERAYRRVMSGAMDGVATFPGTPRGERLQEEQFVIATRAGVNSTPTFMISGRIVTGFDRARIEELLGN